MNEFLGYVMRRDVSDVAKRKIKGNFIIDQYI